MSDTSLHTKYRPTKFSEVLGQPTTVKALEGALKGKRAHAYVLTGPSGTGKTTLARIAADYLCGDHANPSNIVEIDAASHTGIDAMREVASRTHYRAVGGADTKIVIVDECHRLSGAAWASLLKIIEEPPNHVFWFFLTTEPGKIPKTILTRCLRFDLKPVNEDLIFKLLVEVAEAEGMDSRDTDVLEAIAEGAGGSPRQALVFLEQCRFAETAADARQAMRSAGQSKEVIDLARWLLKGRGQTWAEAMRFLKDLEGTEAEGIRIVVSAYISTVLMGTKVEKEAVRLLGLLEAFSKPYNNTDRFAPLMMSIGMAMGLDQ